MVKIPLHFIVNYTLLFLTHSRHPFLRPMELFEIIVSFGPHLLLLSLFDHQILFSNIYAAIASFLLPLLLYRLLTSPMIVTRCLSDVPPPPPHLNHYNSRVGLPPPSPTPALTHFNTALLLDPSAFIHPHRPKTHAQCTAGQVSVAAAVP